MIYLVGVILFGVLAILQSTIVSRMTLLNGTADLILLFVIAWALQEKVEFFMAVVHNWWSVCKCIFCIAFWSICYRIPHCN